MYLASITKKSLIHRNVALHTTTWFKSSYFKTLGDNTTHGHMQMHRGLETHIHIQIGIHASPHNNPNLSVKKRGVDRRQRAVHRRYVVTMLLDAIKTKAHLTNRAKKTMIRNRG